MKLRDEKLPTQHRRLGNIRSIKMLRPLCKSDPETGFDGCEDVPGAYTTAWWKDCLARGHDPYYKTARRREKRPITRAILDDDGNPTGRLEVTGEAEQIILIESPNTTQVQTTPHVSGHTYGFDSLMWARAHGYIFPQDHPTKPLKDYCDYFNCWSQNITVRDQTYGNYCNEDSARLVALGARGKAIEVLHKEKMQEQLDSVRLTG